MALFGSNWLEDTHIDDDRPLFGSGWIDETHKQYFLDDDGEFKEITNRREQSEAIDNDNIYTFDGTHYNKTPKQQ